MTHELIKLPYANDALEPVISAETIQYHHGKHLKGYVDTLNKLLPDSDLKDASLEDLVRKAEGKLYNQAGQVMNHNMYFLQFAPNAGGQPEGKLADAIKRDFGSFEEFQKAFNDACTSLFGSGWAWLASDDQGKLSIEKEPNAGNPLRKGLKPLMCFDVWEHAYYLSYQNRRADHVKDLWSIIDWKEVARRYEA
ncbi:superoxide dismutase [Porphyromonas sp.]|uniref:superoxide dismutase n=1 Tax=Porphyromonas sp. TaxID=1924944 RepID=UPI0025CCBEA2|nr:superoxide dismutase [Porphyromonas sp.]